MTYRIKEHEFDEALNYAMLRGDMAKVYSISKESRNLKGTHDPVLIQREKERVMRAQLNSQDGNTAEIHDQFYRDHKLLLVLFRVLAVMPITRSQPGRITFSWRSAASIYAFTFYLFASLLVCRIGWERIQILQNTEKFDEYVYGILFVIFLVPHFWIPFVGWGVANTVAEYKTMWGAFQVSFSESTTFCDYFLEMKREVSCSSPNLSLTSDIQYFKKGAGLKSYCMNFRVNLKLWCRPF